MQLLQKTTFVPRAGQSFFALKIAALLGLLLVAAAARGQAYYSYAPVPPASPIIATPSTCGVFITCGGVQLSSDTQINNLTLTANVYAAQSPVRVQLPLTGTAPAGYRAGMLVSSLSTLASLDALRTATLRTYLDNTPQETQLVDLALLKAALLAGNGSPEQLEFTSTMPFNRVELELGSVTSPLGRGLKVQYAYGVASTSARQVTGYVSRFATTTGQYDTGGCTSGINNAERTVDNDLTNYATFASLLSVNCPEKLKVNLEGISPAGYRAGFVVGGLDNLLNVDLLGGTMLKTYKDGVQQEMATGISLLELSVLPSGQSLVSFPTTKSFDAVSIERAGAVTVLDNMQLYYGIGVAATPATQLRSNWDTPANHFTTYSNGVLCVSLTGCSVNNGVNAADTNLTNFATLNVTAGLASSAGLQLDVMQPDLSKTSVGQAGNRAGMVLAHQGGLLDLSALGRITLTTYDAGGNVLETHSGAALLRLDVLPDGRQTVSFNTTRDFATVGITIGGVLNVVDTTNIYYAFADDSNGQVNIIAPASPLPVVLISLAVRRTASAGPVEISWATASELNSQSFVVERSTDPAAGFVAVGQVAAAGNSATTRQYSLRDAEATSLRGIVYYRLRQLDRDGTATLSKVLVLAASPAITELSLYPNPAPTAAIVTLAASSLPAGATVSVYSGLGQLLGHPTAADGAAVIVPTAGLVPGLYHVVLRDAAGQVIGTQRLRMTGE